MSEETMDVQNANLAITVQKYLSDLNEKIVFAESCTGGEVASTLARLPGISEHLCGSIVSYRPSCKEDWLGVDPRTIEKHTTESLAVAEEMAFGALVITPEASWSLAIVGHFGPNAPEEEDGKVFICLMRRTNKGKLKVMGLIEDRIPCVDRSTRQKVATEICLTRLTQHLVRRVAQKTV